MKTSLNPDLNKLIEKCTINTPIPCYRISEGNEIVEKFYKIECISNPQGQFQNFTLRVGGQIVTSIQMTQLKNFYNILQDHCGGFDYATIKNDTLWKTIYDVKPRGLSAHINGLDTISQVESVLCRGRCNFYLPLTLITIDHQVPKSQSLDGRGAILKVFRGLGLTKGSAVGLKGTNITLQTWKNDVAPNIQQIAVPPTQNTKSLRNTLNDLGMLYYSLFRYAGGASGLRFNCVHHFLNLRPMCSVCNSSRPKTISFK